MSHLVHRHFDTLHRRWVAQTKNDSELRGPQFKEKLEIARLVLKRYGNKGLVDILEQTRMGSHPELIKCLWRVGKALSISKQKPKSIGELFYPGFNPG